MSEHGQDAIGLDIGGTTLKAVRVRADGHVLAKVTLSAGGRIQTDALLSAVDQAIADLGGLQAVGYVGIAVGGIVRPDGSMPATATNLPNLAEVPLPQFFSTHCSRPCTVLNDAHAALHGEAWIGAAHGIGNVVMVTFGTGIGGGVMLDGKVRRGAHGTAGEIGAVLMFDDGQGMTFEDLAAPVRFAARHGRPLADALLAAARNPASDPAGASALTGIGRALASAHLLLDLDAILIGGGMTAVGEPLRAALERATLSACPGPMQHGLVVKLSELGAYAGAIGAVAPSVIPRPSKVKP